MNKTSNYKYVIAVASFILMATSFSIINGVSTILIAPIISANNFSLGEYSFLFTINAITISIFSPIVGALLNKINIKIIMTISSLLAGIGFILYGFANNILQFYLIGVVVSLGVCGLTTIPISTMISDWFEPNKKGSIMGIVFAGIGTGTFFWLQLVSRILEKYTYNAVFKILGTIVLVASFIISLFIAKRPSDAYIHKKNQNNNESSKSPEKKHFNFSSLYKSVSFWFFSIGLFLFGISFAGIKQHYQTYFSFLGHPLSFSANMGSILSLIGVCTNILGGILFDKFKTRNILLIFALLSNISIVFLLLSKINIFVYLFIISFGMTMCMASVWPSIGVSKIFSDKNYSVIFGISSMFNTIGASIGPFLAGVIADTSYGYPAAWVIYLFLNIICYILFIKSVK